MLPSLWQKASQRLGTHVQWPCHARPWLHNQRGWRGQPPALPLQWSDPMTLQDLIEELGGNLVQGDPEWMVDGVNSSKRPAPSTWRLLIRMHGGLGARRAMPASWCSSPARQGVSARQVHHRIRSSKTLVCQGREAGQKAGSSCGIAHSAVVAPDAKVDPGVVVGPCAVIGSHVRSAMGHILAPARLSARA